MALRSAKDGRQRLQLCHSPPSFISVSSADQSALGAIAEESRSRQNSGNSIPEKGKTRARPLGSKSLSTTPVRELMFNTGNLNVGTLGHNPILSGTGPIGSVNGSVKCTADKTLRLNKKCNGAANDPKIATTSSSCHLDSQVVLTTACGGRPTCSQTMSVGNGTVGLKTLSHATDAAHSAAGNEKPDAFRPTTINGIQQRPQHREDTMVGVINK